MTDEESPAYRRWRVVLERGCVSILALGTLNLVYAALVAPRWDTFDAGQTAAAWVFVAVMNVLTLILGIWMWRAFRVFWRER